jgi:hypothetical protein
MKTALITGASSGIGYELSKVFAQNGINVILVARNFKMMEELKSDIERVSKVDVKIINQDLSTPGAAQVIFDTLNNEAVKVDYLVNNAGFGDYGFFAQSNWEKNEQMINLNILTLTHLTHLFLPLMIKQKYGRIINVASTAAFQPGPLMAVYYATKAFVLSFSEAIANELEGSGVTVTALCPGPTSSGFEKAAAVEDSKLFKGKKLPSSKEVASYGYKAMMNGKTVAIHGVLNNIFATSVRFTPRKVVTKIVRKLSETSK